MCSLRRGTHPFVEEPHANAKGFAELLYLFSFFLFFFSGGGKDLFDGGLTDRSGRNCEGVCS